MNSNKLITENTLPIMGIVVAKLLYDDYNEKYKDISFTKRPKISFEEIKDRLLLSINRNIDIDNEIENLYLSGLFTKIETEDGKKYYAMRF